MSKDDNIQKKKVFSKKPFKVLNIFEVLKEIIILTFFYPDINVEIYKKSRHFKHEVFL